MKTRIRKWAVVGGAALVGVLAFSTISFAQTPDPATDSPPQGEQIQQGAPNGLRPCDPGFGERGFRGGDGQAALAEALGMTVDELHAALQNGQTVEEIAAEKGVDLDAVKAELKAQHLADAQERLAQAVADGKLTQEQADQILEKMQNGECPDFGPRGRRGPGGQRGPRGGQNSAPPNGPANPNL